MDKEKTISEVVFPIIKGQFITCTKNQCECCLTPCSSQETANKIEVKLINAGYGNVKQAVKEFADELENICMERASRGLFSMVGCKDIEELKKVRFGK